MGSKVDCVNHDHFGFEFKSHHHTIALGFDALSPLNATLMVVFLTLSNQSTFKDVDYCRRRNPTFGHSLFAIISKNDVSAATEYPRKELANLLLGHPLIG